MSARRLVVSDGTCPRCGLPTFTSLTAGQGFRHLHGHLIDCHGTDWKARAEKAEAQRERWVSMAGGAAAEIGVLVDFMQVLLGEHYGPDTYPDEPEELTPLVTRAFSELKARAEKAEAAVARVRTLHRCYPAGCEECTADPDEPVPCPCPTLRALDGE